MSTVYILRSWTYEDSRRIWIAFNERYTLRGKPQQTKAQVLAAFIKEHGIEVTNTVRFTGICRPSEAAATIASVREG